MQYLKNLGFVEEDGEFLVVPTVYISRMTDGAAGTAAVVLEYGSAVAIVAIGLLLLVAML